jgi:hypothetical protein
MTELTASEVAKAHGFDSLREVAALAAVTVQTLNNWHNDRPDFFEIVLTGCARKKEPLPITVMHCQCGEEGCKVYQLGGIGRWTHGSGFDEDDARLIARLLNQYHSVRNA